MSDAQSPTLFDRDLSWLQFNIRVLEEAEDESNPILERVKFLAISASNLDEFHMVRLSALEHALDISLRKGDEAEGVRLLALRSDILTEVSRFGVRQKKAIKALIPRLQEAGIVLIAEIKSLKVLQVARQAYEQSVLPHLPDFEHFSAEKLVELGNLEAAIMCSNDLWVKIPVSLPRLISTTVKVEGNDVTYFFFLDHLIRTFLEPHSLEVGIVRLTRSADDNVDLTNSDPDFIPDTILRTLKSREKGQPVRLEFVGKFPEEVVKKARAVLKLDQLQLFERSTTVFLSGLWVLAKHDHSAPLHSQGGLLSFKPLLGYLPKSFKQQAEIFNKLATKDYLLHHPYDSFDAFVAFIEAAARDSQVSHIEQTIYRMDALSPVVPLLKEAAKTKIVRVVIEPRARFDELNNLKLADELKKAGVKVYFAFGKLKVHAKVALITRKSDKGVYLYTHLSTGNYNSSTARQYTDMSIITSNADIGSDARQFFDALYKREVPHSFKKLVIAPQYLARRMYAHIREETEAALAGRPARIFAKVNALIDPKIIEALYAASRAGVKVDLLVRGACSLVPGQKGLSDNIRVLSIVDRFLEHSRIYYFENARKLYFSSADWMPRNFFSRLEIAFPVLDSRVFDYLVQVVIPAYMEDRAKARVLTSSGIWKRPPPEANSKRAQVYFEELSKNGYRGTPLE